MSELHRTIYNAIREHSRLTDREIIQAGEHGADTGWGGFTYTGDCVEFFDANADEIWQLAEEMADDMGEKSVPALVAGFGRIDMASSYDGFRNLLAWFALEEIGRWLESNPSECKGEDEE